MRAVFLYIETIIDNLDDLSYANNYVFLINNRSANTPKYLIVDSLSGDVVSYTSIEEVPDEYKNHFVK